MVKNCSGDGGEAGDQVEVQPDQLVERVVRNAGVPFLVLDADLRRVAGETVGEGGDEGVDGAAAHDARRRRRGE